MSVLGAWYNSNSVVAMIKVAIGMPTLLELIASTGVSAMSRKSRAERAGVFDIFISKPNLLNNDRQDGTFERCGVRSVDQRHGAIALLRMSSHDVPRRRRL
jgi:hypothetical protein